MGDIQTWDKEWKKMWFGQLQEGLWWGVQSLKQFGPRGNLNCCHLIEKGNHCSQREDWNSGSVQGSGVVVPIWALFGVHVEGKRWKLKRESREQDYSLQKGVFWFIGNFTVWAASLYKRGNRNDHQIKERTWIWKLHSYCSQRRKWHNMNPFKRQWLQMRMGMAQS